MNPARRYSAMGWLVVLAGTLLAVALPEAARAACPEIPAVARTPDTGSPFSPGNKGVTRLDTQTSDNVRITGGCIEPNRIAHIYFAEAYGSCTWDGTHDVGACINEAIAAANAAGGGRVIVSGGTLGVSTPIVLQAKVWLEGAGGANGGQCGTQLKWIGSAGSTIASLGSDASSSTPAGSGLLRMCISGEGVAATAFKIRSAEYGIFSDLYLSKVTAAGIDANPSTAANTNVAFNDFYRVYVDLSDASAINAVGLLIGSGTTDGHDFTQNHFVMFTVNFQDGNGIECGAADYNFFHQSGVEPVGGGTGISLHMLGSASSDLRACRDNFFQGGFGAGGSGGPVAETNTYPSINNDLWLGLTSGGTLPTLNGAATLRYITTNGSYFDNRKSNAGTFGIGAAPSNKAFADFDGEANFATVLKAGSSLPVYLMASQPIVGFNTYWNAAWKFGKGSSASFAGYEQFDTTNGTLSWNVSSAGGNADATATIGAIATLDQTGLFIPTAGVQIPNATTFKTQDGGGTSRNLLQMFSDDKTYLDGGAAGLVIRSNNQAATAATIDSSGNIAFSHGTRLAKFTAATVLAVTCDAAAEGTMFSVTDANSATFNAALAAGGANHIIGYCNGTAWVVH